MQVWKVLPEAVICSRPLLPRGHIPSADPSHGLAQGGQRQEHTPSLGVRASGDCREIASPQLVPACLPCVSSLGPGWEYLTSKRNSTRSSLKYF